jgi:molybdopterin-guanine dinucleotide biosynthesis protein A
MQQVDSPWFVFCPCDTPFIPSFLVERFLQQKASAPVVWVFRPVGLENQLGYRDKRHIR